MSEDRLKQIDEALRHLWDTEYSREELRRGSYVPVVIGYGAVLAVIEPLLAVAREQQEKKLAEARTFAELAATKYNELLVSKEHPDVTCAFCGEVYPDGTPTHSDTRLADHIRVCKQHPMREAEAEHARLHAALSEKEKELQKWITAYDKMNAQAMAAEYERDKLTAQVEAQQRERAKALPLISRLRACGKDSCSHSICHNVIDILNTLPAFPSSDTETGR